MGYVEFHNSETGRDVAVWAAHVEMVNGFVFGHRFVLIVGYVDHLAPVVEQIDIIVVVDDNKLVHATVPCYHVDSTIVENVCFIERFDALVVTVVGVEISRRKYIELVCGRLYPRYIAIGHVGFP